MEGENGMSSERLALANPVLCLVIGIQKIVDKPTVESHSRAPNP